MLRRILFMVALVISLMSGVSTLPAHAAYDPLQVCTDAGVDVCKQENQKNSTLGPVGDALSTGTKILSIIGAVAAVFYIIIGGYKYVLSAGDSKSVQSAKNTILYALIGLVIIIAAQPIIRFALDRLFKQ